MSPSRVARPLALAAALVAPTAFAWGQDAAPRPRSPAEDDVAKEVRELRERVRKLEEEIARSRPGVASVGSNAAASNPAAAAPNAAAPNAAAPPNGAPAPAAPGTVGPERQEPERYAPETVLRRAVTSALDSVELHGTLDLDYVWNTENPHRRIDVNRIRVNDPDSDTFEVGWAKLAVLRATTTRNEWDGGFHLAIAVGREVENTLSLDPHFLFQQPINVAQAYVDLQMPTPFGKPLLVRFGRFYSWFGVESLDTALNPSFSLSWFTDFTPFTTMGVGLGMDLAWGFRYTQYVVNGWDVVIDNNDAKTLGGQLSWKHVDPDTQATDATVAFNWIWGPEKTDDNHDPRTQLELAATAKPWDGATLLGALDYGQEQHGAVPPRPGTGHFRHLTGEFGGVMGIVRQELGEVEKGFYRFAVAARAEYWRDEGGSKSGLDQSLYGTTATFEVHFTEYARLRFEVRRDVSSRAHFFIGHRGLPTTDQQITLSADAAFSF